jgi:hypothetical protein
VTTNRLPASLLVLLVNLFCLTSPLPAGGPNYLTGSHTPIRWPAGPVPYVMDNGALSAAITRDQGAVQVRAALKVWEDVPTSTISFDERGFLSVDIDASNFQQYLGPRRSEGNIIVFDADGSITDELFGERSDDVLGFAQTFPNATRTEFSHAYAVLNGLNAGGESFLPTIIHELGHLIGLDHTQAGMDKAFNGDWRDNDRVPIMFPYMLFRGPRLLLPDDVAWVSWLYPAPGFRESTGTITGQIFFPDGTPLPGANVVAVRVSRELGGGISEQVPFEAVSVVSDFLEKGDGSYEIPGLIPGEYAVFIEPLHHEFIAGSGVGPYEYRFTNFFKEYFGESEESERGDIARATVLPVGQGATVAGIDLFASEISNRLDLLTDDSEMLFRFPDGFRFPFFGKTYTEVYVNSDGNLTFETGDGIPGAARDAERFLNGPPRIAPLFTDLDPGEFGEVTSSTAPGEVTFTWDGVPEFAESGLRPGNRFSVTLFANGDIRFKYDLVSITPDPDEEFPTGLQAITGVTPGGGAAGDSSDLSVLGPTIALGSAPVFEVFPGSTFDLGGKEIFFVTSVTRLMFPFYAGDGANFSGYALTNFSTGAALLEIQGLGRDGNLLPFVGNPHGVTVEPQQQVAKLGSEFFSIDMSTLQDGWIRMSANTGEVASFFQFGNGLTGSLTKMDGSIALQAQSKLLFFSRIFDGPATFPAVNGPRDATTTISIANPNDSSIRVRFNFYGPSGQPVASQVERTIPANGMLRERVSTLMSTQAPLNDGYLKAEVVQGTGAIGFELIELQDTLLGLNASYGNPGGVLYSAQLAAGTAAGIAVFTNIKIVNTSSQSRVVTITPYGANGMVLSTPLANIALQPNQTFQGDASELFGFSIVGPETVGSLVVEANGAGVIGDVIFGDPFVGEYAAALPLQSVPFRKAIFSQVANGTIDPTDPSMDTFTGVAFFNPGSQSARITLKVFDREGAQVGTTRTINLAARNRISDLVENLVAGTATLIQGYISVESTVPIVAQQLFANGTLKFMSAVPPQIIE